MGTETPVGARGPGFTSGSPMSIHVLQCPPLPWDYTGSEEAKRQGRGAGSVTEELARTGKTPDLVTFILQEGTLRLRPTQDHQASQRQGLCTQRPHQALVGP